MPEASFLWENLLSGIVTKNVRGGNRTFIGNVNRCVRTNRCKSKTVGENFMVWLLRKCVKCGEYTLSQETCPLCGGNLRIPHPAKFSPEDKYAKYRRAMRGSVQNEKVGH
jgi:H/ACA ribonucleoprotein complex subunit 3